MANNIITPDRTIITPEEYRKEVIDLKFTPRFFQRECYRDMKRFNIYVVHRRAGKSWGTIMRLFKSAAQCTRENGQYGFIGPYYEQTKKIAWYLISSRAAMIPGTKISESDLCVTFPNGAQFFLMGGNNPKSVRGSYFDGLGVDELSDIKPDLWESVLYPMLNNAGRFGWAILQGTPKGINLLSEKYLAALEKPDWSAKKFTIYDTQTFTPEEIASIKANMTPEQFAQEFLCDFSVGNNSCLLTERDVIQAMMLVIPPDAYNYAPKIMGVDVARQGDDSSVIAFRQGNFGAKAPSTIKSNDIMQVAARVMEEDEKYRADQIFVDGTGGYGSGVIDRLRQLGKTNVVEVQFAGKPEDERFENKRVEMYWRLAQAVKGGLNLPNDQRLKIDLCAPNYTFANAKGKMQLESKEDIKDRGFPSPDYGDAYALTYAFTVHKLTLEEAYGHHRNDRSDSSYDPFMESQFSIE